MKRKLVALGLVLTMVLQVFMTGCSGSGTGGEGGNNGGEASKGTELKLGVVAKGYGDEYVYKMAEAFEKKTGIKTTVAKSSAEGEWVNASLQAGTSGNNLDVIFDIRNTAMRDVAVKGYVPGYDRAYADLSDIYGTKVEGYKEDKTLKELVGDYILSACTWDLDNEGYGDGKQYFVSYATGLEGIIYNAELFEKYDLKEPKTSTEFFALCDKIKTLSSGSYPKNADGREIYPFVYSGKVSYCSFLADVWMAQYDGVATFHNMLQGKDANGLYTADSLKTQGKLSAYEHISKLISQKNGYVNTNNFTTTFTNAQLLFLDQQAFMTISGDWLEQEMASNVDTKDMNIRFMRIPVNSDIILKCDSVTTEERLVETIAYIDGETSNRPDYLSDADLARITEARSLYHCEGNQHIAFIPACSNMIEEAKEFLLFMVSKEGQEIMLEYCHGNMAPLEIDYTQFDSYDTLSSLQKSKYDMLTSNIGMTLIGQNLSYPMGYVGGISTISSSLESSFGVVDTSSSYKTPKQLWNDEYQKYVSEWNTKMKNAGVSN